VPGIACAVAHLLEQPALASQLGVHAVHGAEVQRQVLAQDGVVLVRDLAVGKWRVAGRSAVAGWRQRTRPRFEPHAREDKDRSEVKSEDKETSEDKDRLEDKERSEVRLLTTGPQGPHLRRL
jgi:hypothetical protein